MFIKNGRTSTANPNSMKVLVFQVENEKIISMEDSCIYNTDPNFISLWLIARQINIFYMQHISQEHKAFYKTIGINARTFDEIDSKHIFRAFILE